MSDKPEFHTQGKFTQSLPTYHQLSLMDDVQVEILLQDIMTPPDENDLFIAKDMLTHIGIKC